MLTNSLVVLKIVLCYLDGHGIIKIRKGVLQDIMAGISEITKQLGVTPTPLDSIRRKYIKELSKYTGRETIAYYSGWLSKQNNVPGIEIDDSDMTGLMEVVRGLKCNKGLDLIMHTPGGNPTAAESMVKYLRSKFNNDIRIIVPHLAMSAGTMIACSGKEIIMGKHSSLGPIDPQFNGIPAYSIKKEFEDAKEELSKNPSSAIYWKLKLEKYPAAYLNIALDSIDLAEQLVREWLETCMFETDQDKQKKIDKIVKSLNEHESSKSHGRHFDIDFCNSIGLKIFRLEDDQKLQDKVLSVHHAFTLTFNQSNAVKIIENNMTGSMINCVG